MASWFSPRLLPNSRPIPPRFSISGWFRTSGNMFDRDWHATEEASGLNTARDPRTECIYAGTVQTADSTTQIIENHDTVNLEPIRKRCKQRRSIAVLNLIIPSPNSMSDILSPKRKKENEKIGAKPIVVPSHRTLRHALRQHLIDRDTPTPLRENEHKNPP